MARVDEWVEVAGSSVDLAVTAALQELGLSSRDEVQVEVIQEPSKGILGTAWRAQEAVVKVTPKPKERKKRQRRSRKGRSESSDGDSRRSDDSNDKPKSSSSGQRGGANRSQKSGNRSGKKPQERTSGSSGTPGSSKESDKKPSGTSSRRPPRERGADKTASEPRAAETQEATIEEQATVAAGFIEGLLEAFGLEGTVETTIDEDILKINVTGDQTEALVGRKGAIMQSVHEITRTVVQRKTFGAPRMRLDINGYGERRREALRIYTARQAEQVIANRGEVMLEPMNPADRKVVHDAIGEIEGVESYSEGVEPHRAVVIAPTSTGAE